VSGPAPASSRRGPAGLSVAHLIGAGLVDSTGLAFGWTVVLLVVAHQRGLAAAALLTSSSLVGMALAAPFSAWLSAHWSPRHLLQRLAFGEVFTRGSLFAMMAVGGRTAAMAPLAVLTSMIAWSAYAAMRAQVSRVSEEQHGAGLTWYAASILASEAVAAGAASLLIVHPDALVLLLVGLAYTCSLAPQWWVGAHAEPGPPPAARTGSEARTAIRPVLGPAVVGAFVFLVAAGPTLMAAVLAYERYGPAGVMVAALSFAAGSLGSARLQARVARIPSPTLAACLLGAAMVGGWVAFPLGLPALALVMAGVGLTQCCLEGDLDARTLARLEAGHARSVTGLATAASSRAVGGAAAVAVLPAVISAVTLPVAAALAGGALLSVAAVLTVTARLPHPAAAVPTTPLPRPAAGPAARPAAGPARRIPAPRRPRFETRADAVELPGRSPEQFLALVDSLAHLARGGPAMTATRAH
jgi:hypothetical protein